MNQITIKNNFPIRMIEQGKLIIVLVGVLLATWPTIAWYHSRMTDGSDNNWGIFSLIIALLISFLKPTALMQKTNFSIELRKIHYLLAIYIISMSLSIYPMIQAVIVVMLYSCVLSQFNRSTKISPGLVGLLFLSLPLFASLDFYCGYPLRIIIGIASSFILNLQGVGVNLEGVNLVLGNKVIMIDGPCSGIKMMWTGSLMVFSIVAYYNLTLKQSFRLAVIAFTSILIANILRICALFYIETTQLNAPWLHDAVGLVCYFAATIIILYFALQQINQPIKVAT
ncbi:hypothetical protein MNBD_GAMMA12-1918 [hydrothermal vent metagenome]|uniref:Eight transmembrane protein EpsH n=1 Tax=hydrothermal vent metagenome TaxID=652676 RepID=A0A3B0Z475_9ZZZZ